jgi:hypothetical protein
MSISQPNLNLRDSEADSAELLHFWTMVRLVGLQVYED